MTEPERNDGAIHAVAEELHRGRVSQHVRADPFPFQGGAPPLRDVYVSSHEPFDRIAAQCAAARRRKERVTWLPVALAEPGGEHADHIPLQRRAALLPALALAPEMGAGPQHDVSAAQVNDLGHAQAGLDREEQQCTIASADPGRGIRRSEHGVDFGAGEIRNRPPLMPLDRDGQNLTTAIEMGRLADRHVATEGVDGREADIARARRVPAVLSP